MRTIGISIGLPEPWASEVQAVRRASGDPQAEHIKTHITLVPPTVIADGDLAGVRRHLAAVAARHEPYDVELAGTGTFRPVSSVVFLTLVAGDAQCRALAADLLRGPLGRDLDFPYHPHVTLAHDIAPAALDAAAAAMTEFALRFAVRAFQLFEQGADSVWREVEAFALRGDPGDRNAQAASRR